MDTIGSRIRQARTALRLSQQEVADEFKISRTSVTLWENGNSRPDQSKLGRLADFLEVDLEWLLEAKGPAPKRRDRKRLAASARNGTGESEITATVVEAIPGGDLVGPADLPVYAAARGGEEHLIVTFDAIDYVKRPEPLARVKGGYGLLITGDSMIPAFWPGDIALVNPHLPASVETDVILYHTKPSGEAEAMIKHLVAMNDREWTLEQYRPARNFREFRADWPICHRVVGKYSRR